MVQAPRPSRHRDLAEFDALVDEASKRGLKLLCDILHLDVGFAPTMAWMRNKLFEANKPTNTRIAMLDVESWRSNFKELDDAAEAAAAERKAEADALAAADLIREQRRDQLRADIHSVRQMHVAQKGYHMSKWSCLQTLLKPGAFCGWHLRSKNKGVELYLGEVAWAWTVLQPGSFIDYSLLAGGRVDWADVPELEPLEQLPDAQGRVLLRTNSRSAVKLRMSHQCILEAALFATAHTTLAELNATGFAGKRYEAGIPTHELNVRLQKTPYSLYDWQWLVKRRTGIKRGADGAARRRQLVLFDIISVPDAILIAVAAVEDVEGRVTSYHAIVWDGWRRLLFIGPGSMDDRGLDGCLLLQRAECEDAARVDKEHGVTVSEHIHQRFGIRYIQRAHVVMVSLKRRAETHHV